MIPLSSITPVAILSSYIPPDDIAVGDLEDFELGGIGLSNPSQGLQVQVWRAFVVGTASATTVWVESPTQPAVQLFASPNITWVRLAFDQNMHPFVAFVDQSGSRYWWFDPTVPGQVFATLPAGSSRASCAMDDKRPLSTQLGTNDIILSYINVGNNLVYRQERDRYNTEYVLLANVNLIISAPFVGRIGMNEKLRLQIEIRGALYQ